MSTLDDNRAHRAAIYPRPFTKHAISAGATTAVHAPTQASSDGPSAFRALAEEIAQHHAIITGSGHAAAEHAKFRCVNTVMGNLKTAITRRCQVFKFVK